jgi:NTP pyrophosphatase (non-canonical NTP hydrolase)
VNLTDEQKEIFCIAQEECAEVTQAISKIFRFGLDESFNGRTNRERLQDETGDLLAMIELLVQKSIISPEGLEDAKIKKLEKLKTWSKINLSEIA